jgi:c-di-GMP-binding flagellar brake protein YcgR
MNKPKVEVNDILQIRVIDDPKSPTYRSRVENLNAEHLIIDWPTSNGVLVPVHLDRPLSLAFIRQDAAYSFLGIVQERNKEPFPQLKIRILGPPERIQRRQNFRIKVPVAIQIKGIVNLPGHPQVDLCLSTQTYDLGGSGLAIRSELPIPVGTVLDITIAIDEPPPLEVLARVVNSELVVTQRKKSLSHVGFSFIGLKEAQQMRLVRYLFRVQIKQMVDLQGRTFAAQNTGNDSSQQSLASNSGQKSGASHDLR